MIINRIVIDTSNFKLQHFLMLGLVAFMPLLIILFFMPNEDMQYNISEYSKCQQKVVKVQHKHKKDRYNHHCIDTLSCETDYPEDVLNIYTFDF